MKIFFDFLPIVVFFVVFKWYGIYAATASAIGITAFQVLVLLLLKRKIQISLWVNLALIVLLGGATIIFHNEWFIKWKPTILYLFFAISLIVSDKIFNKNLIKLLSGDALNLQDNLWQKLSTSWAVFFVTMAVLNISVAYSVSTDMWVNFKLFGLLGLTILFGVGQGFYLAKNMNSSEK
jgi:intracellular septation protein